MDAVEKEVARLKKVEAHIDQMALESLNAFVAERIRKERRAHEEARRANRRALWYILVLVVLGFAILIGTWVVVLW